MIQALPIRVDSVRAQQRSERWTWAGGYLAIVGVGLLIGLLRFGALADPFPLSLAVLLAGAVAIMVRPIAGVYLTLFLGVLGDGQVMGGYPFDITFATKFSFLHIADSLKFTPLELYLALTLLSWLAHVAGARGWFRLGRPLLKPVLVFFAFLGVGFVYGVILRGGDRTVGLWELRPLLCLVLMYVLASNLLTRTSHYVSLAWVAALAISIQNLFALHFYYALSRGQRATLETLTEHTTSIFYTWMILLTVGLVVFRGCSRWARALLLFAVLPTAWVFVLSQRRAAAVALVAGFVVFAVVLYFRRRRAFWVIVPLTLLVGVGYTAAFWNATEGVGFGARAIKAVIAKDQVSERDAASDIYRNIENYNLVYTVRATPLTGVGFGKPFYQPVRLPDISFFVFWQYIPHNSVLWVWLKLGYLGFVALLFLVAAALRAGTRASLQLPSGDALAVTVGALVYIVMFFVFAYVDIVWQARTCVFLAVCMATCANMARLARAEREVVDDAAELQA